MLTRGRVLPVALLAAASVAAALIATWPAGATSPRPASPPQTVNRFYFHDGPEALADSGSNIATIALPKGAWVITVKLWVDKATPGGDLFVACSMGLVSPASADGDNVAYYAPTTAGGAGAAPVVMTASHLFEAPGSLTVGCGDNGTNAQYHQLRIQAVKVASIARTPI